MPERGHDEQLHDHGHDDHHDVTAAPEPDNIRFGQVLAWGIGSFLFVIVSILALTGYFWTEREGIDEAKIYGVTEAQIPGFVEKLEALRNEEQARLSGQFELESGKTTMPIDKAMAELAKMYGKQ